MKQSKCEIKDIPISELKQSKYNPRKNLKPGDTEYEKMKNSILNFGYVEPVIWNKRSGNIVGGHQRAKVMQDLGYESITCIVVDLDDLQEKTLNIALNKITGEWDIPLLTDLLKEIDNSDFDVCLTGFEPEELGEMFGEVNPDDLTGDDFDVEAEYENINTTFTELGDVWCIGNHRLMCGDSTSKDDVSELIDGNVMDMCFTDPPYNVNYESANTGKIINDNMSDNEFLTFLIAAFKMIVFSLKPGGAFYICHADSEGLNFRKAVKSVGLLMKQCIIWVKNSFVLGRQDYHWQHEPILYGWKDGAAHYFTDDRTKSTVIDDWKDTDFSKMKKFELIEFLNKLKTEQNVSTSIIREDKPKRNPDHPTMKPIRLCARCIQNSCRRNEKVIDLFGGSGSTLIACEQINRSAYLMELDPKFCDVIVRRYIQTFHDSKNIFLIRNGQKMTFEDLEF